MSLARACCALSAALLVHACGDDSAAPAADASAPAQDTAVVPPADSGPPPMECLYVDGRGSAEADGSAARPFATIDDAVAAALESMSAVMVCLTAGEHAPPLAAVPGGITLSGPATEDPAGRAAIRGAVGPCLRANGLDLGDPEAPIGDVMTAVLTDGDAPVVLRDLDIQDCDVGVVARGAGGVVLERVNIERTIGGVVVDAASSGTLRDVTVSHAFRIRTLDTQAVSAAVSAGEGAQLEIAASRFESGRGPSFGVVARAADLDLEDVAIVGHTSWLVVQRNDGHRAALRRVELQRQTAVSSLGEVPSASIVEGGTFEADDLLLEGGDGRGLQLARGDFTLRGLRATGIASAAVAVYGGTLQVSGDTSLSLPGDRSYGLVAGRSPDGDTARISIDGALQSSADASGSHLIARNGGSIEVIGAATLSGGSIGAVVDLGGRLSARGTLTVESPELAGVAVAAAGSSVDLDGLEIRQADVRSESGGVVALDGARVVMNGGTVRGGLFGLLCSGCETTDLRDVSVEEATYGLAFHDVPAAVEQTVTGLSVRASRGPGVLVLGAWQLSLEGCSVRDSAGVGIEAQDGASLRVDGCEIGGNAGAGVALYDASAVIVGSTFDASIPALVGASMSPRADEIRIVSTTGSTREVFIGDDGDRMFEPAESNLFRLLGPRVCDGGCSVVFADGPGAVGIVTPNCLTADMGAAGVFSLVEQRSASFEFVGITRMFWSGQLAGIGVDLGLDAGAASPASDLTGFGVPDLSALDAVASVLGP